MPNNPNLYSCVWQFNFKNKFTHKQYQYMTGSEYKALRKLNGITTFDLQRSGVSSNTYTSIECDGNYTKKSLQKYLSVIEKKK